MSDQAKNDTVYYSEEYADINFKNFEMENLLIIKLKLIQRRNYPPKALCMFQ